MKYTKEQRLDIGRRIYYSEISRYEAAEEYGISEQTARNYMRMYRDVNRLPPKHGQRSIGALSFKKEPVELDELKSMTKEELIQELVKRYTIIIVTHNMQQAGRVSDHTSFFLNGKIIETDVTEKIFSNPSDQRTEDYITGRFG